MEPTYKIAQRLHERRAAVGLKKYGQHLTADNPGCMIVHALEEAADLTEYLLAELQRRKHLIQKLEALAEEMRADKAPRWAFELEKMSDLLGGPSALAKYDEILDGGTVAEDATVAPRSGMPKEQLDRIRQEIAKVSAINRPLTIEERKDFDRTLEQLRDADEAPDPRKIIAEAIADLSAPDPRRTDVPDRRDEALRVAAGKIHHWHDWGENNEGMVVSSAAVRELWGALAAIRGAL